MPRIDTLMPTTIEYASQPISAERRLQELAIYLPVTPEPFGTYTEAAQARSLLFLSGTLPTEGRTAKFVGRVGAELDVTAGCEAARLAAINAVAIARQHLGSLDRVKRIVRLGVSAATEGNVSDLPKVADGASDILRDVFGTDKNPTRRVHGAASLPLGTPVNEASYLRCRDEEDRSDSYGYTYHYIVGSTCRGGAAANIPDLLSNYCDRWPIDFLS